MRTPVLVDAWGSGGSTSGRPWVFVVKGELFLARTEGPTMVSWGALDFWDGGRGGLVGT